MKHVMPALVLIGLIAAADRPAVATQAQAPQQGAAKGIIKGRVVAADNGRPLRRARLLLRLANPPPGGAPPIIIETTNQVGQFELKNVPAGSYRLVIERSGYLSVEYGQRRTREPGQTLEVKEDGVVDRLEVRLPRASVIAGVVTDERGLPYPGAKVDAYELRYSGGRRLPTPADSATTDDRGRYRISRLEPGSYYVAANSAERWTGAAGATFGFAATFFPAVTADRAESVAVAIGQVKDDVNIALIADRTATISGRLVRQSGESLAGEIVSVQQEVANRPITVGSMRVASDGSFEFRDLAPGLYRVGSSGQGNGRSENALVRVTLTGNDVTGLAVVRSPGSVVAGTVVVEEGSPPIQMSGLRVNRLTEGAPGVLGFQTLPVEENGSFRIVDVLSPPLLRMNGLPDGWVIKRLRLGERELPEGFLDLERGKDITGLQVVLSSKGARVTGSVVDANTKLTADATIVLFADAESLWVRGSRYLRTARPNPNGEFSIPGLLPGRYRIAALEYVEDGAAEAPEFLARIKSSASVLEVGESSAPTITLKVQ